MGLGSGELTLRIITFRIAIVRVDCSSILKSSTMLGTDKERMARIPILQEDDPGISEDGRAFLAQARRARGRTLNLYRALANRPEAGRAFSELVRTVYRSESTLPAKDAELAYLTATVVNNCYY